MITEEMMSEIKHRLVRTYDPIAIYIFGSYAWGSPDEESDLDLLVVVDHLTQDRFKTMTDGYRALTNLKLSKDILVYSKKEFDQCASDVTSICNRILREGKMIYGKA